MARGRFLVQGVYAMSEDGTVVAHELPGTRSTGLNLAFRPYFQQAIQGAMSVCAAIGSNTQERGLCYAARLYESDTPSSNIIDVVMFRGGFEPVDLLLKPALCAVARHRHHGQRHHGQRRRGGRQRCFAAGMRDPVAKPIEPAALWAALAPAFSHEQACSTSCGARAPIAILTWWMRLWAFRKTSVASPTNTWTQHNPVFAGRARVRGVCLAALEVHPTVHAELAEARRRASTSSARTVLSSRTRTRIRTARLRPCLHRLGVPPSLLHL